MPSSDTTTQLSQLPKFRVHFNDGGTIDVRAATTGDIQNQFRSRGIRKIKLVREDDPRPGIGGRNHA